MPDLAARESLVQAKLMKFYVLLKSNFCDGNFTVFQNFENLGPIRTGGLLDLTARGSVLRSKRPFQIKKIVMGISRCEIRFKGLIWG